MRKPITRTEFNRVVRQVKEALRLASTHDPDHELRFSILEKQMQDIGAPSYRVIQRGKRLKLRRK